VRSGGTFDEAAWARWCREAAARPLPGALAFTRLAADHGVAVYYLSNRSRDLDVATLANLRAAGFPVPSPDVFLGRGTAVAGCVSKGGDKGCRRREVGRTHRVLLQVGDQLGDFLDVAVNTPAGRQAAMAPYADWIGERWFVLPNPTYGAWVSALERAPGPQDPTVRRREKLEALRY
jgi:5'-nucleotidase (lipoprotein e(P4) family)